VGLFKILVQFDLHLPEAAVTSQLGVLVHVLLDVDFGLVIDDLLRRLWRILGHFFGGRRGKHSWDNGAVHPLDPLLCLFRGFVKLRRVGLREPVQIRRL
jgi:hypothetical protein